MYLVSGILDILSALDTGVLHDLSVAGAVGNRVLSETVVYSVLPEAVVYSVLPEVVVYSILLETVVFSMSCLRL